MKSIRQAATFPAMSDPPIVASELARAFNLDKPISLLNLLRLANECANNESMTPLLFSGPYGIKINIAVLGDGFAAGDDQIIYNNKVKDLLIHGVFNHDFFLEQKQNFNIYRINLISQDSGVSTKTYDNGNLTGVVDRNTALGFYYNNSWEHDWLEGGSYTAIITALDKWIPDYHLVLILLNTSGDNGHGGNCFAYVGVGCLWSKIAHEFGHALAYLADEYCHYDDAYCGPEPFEVNITTCTEKSHLKWRDLLDPNTPIPTGIGKCAGYTEGPMPPWWDINQSVGLFEGGGFYSLGMYRPAIICRMKDEWPPYCPVCYKQMKYSLEFVWTYHMTHGANITPFPEEPFSESDGKPRWIHHEWDGNPTPLPSDGKTRKAKKDDSVVTGPSEGYIRLNIHVENGKLSVTDIREVPGPLATPRAIIPGHFYEVMVGDKSIALGFLPDLGIRRSFANLDVPGPARLDRITTVPSYDFFARIPKSQISAKTLPQLNLVVHKVQQVPEQLIKSVPLLKHTGFKSTEVGRLVGINLKKLPKEVRPRLQRILKDNRKLQ